MSEGQNSAPDMWKKSGRVYGHGLTLEIAKKMLEAGEQEAERQQVPMVMAIADEGGNLLAFHRMENALLASINIATDKAYTAVFSKAPTFYWTTAFKEGGFAPLRVHEKFIPFPGGFPIIKDSVVVGGLGVSGGIIEDMYVVRAMLQTGGFSLEEVNETIAQMSATE